MRDDIHPIEDAFHRIQSPAPETVTSGTNEQIHDAICVEFWNAGIRHEVQVAVSDRQIVLTGVKSAGPLHRKCVAVAKRLGHGRVVVDETIASDEAMTPPSGPSPAARIDGDPALFVARYCGLDAASIRAGITSAIEVLEAFLSREHVGIAKDAVLIYRNLRTDTVTIEVGYAVPDNVVVTAHDEVRRGKTPVGPMLSEAASHGGHALARDFAALRAKARRQGMEEPVYFWQHLPDPHEPWPADRATRLFAAWK